MKIEHLTLKEAGQMYKDGKCEGIIPQEFYDNPDWFYIINDGDLCYSDLSPSYNPIFEELIGEWKLYKPKKWKMVVRNVTWASNEFGNIWPEGKAPPGTKWEDLVGMGKMKITLELEEDQED